MPPNRRARLDELPPESLEASVLSQGGCELLLLSFSVEPDQNISSLSRAELEIVDLLRDGLSQAQIARARGTSARTVANQVSSLYRKLGVQSKAELLARAVSWPRARLSRHE